MKRSFDLTTIVTTCLYIDNSKIRNLYIKDKYIMLVIILLIKVTRKSLGYSLEAWENPAMQFSFSIPHYVSLPHMRN